MEVNNNLNKLQLVLQYVFEGKINIQEDYAEKLLKFLEDSDENTHIRPPDELLGFHNSWELDLAGQQMFILQRRKIHHVLKIIIVAVPGPVKLILGTPCFTDLVYQALGDINNADISAKVFLIQLLTIIFKNEQQFNKIYQQDFTMTFCKLNTLYNFESYLPPSLYLACLKLATVQITHSSGLKLILKCKMWKNILQPNIHFKPKNISNAVYSFMATLVSKLNEYNLEAELTEILEDVLEPIRNNGYLSLPVLDIETDTKLCEKIFTHISVLHAIIARDNKYTAKINITPLLEESFIVNHLLYDMYLATKNTGLQQIIRACFFRLCFGRLQHLLFTKKTEEFCIKMTVAYRNLLMTTLNKWDPFGIMDAITQSNLIWSDIKKSHTTALDFPLLFEQYGHKIEFSFQIFIPFIVPFVRYAALQRISKTFEVTNLIEHFLAKLGKSITDYILSFCFKFKELLDEADIALNRKMTVHSLKELLRFKGHLSKSQAGVIFLSLYYLLEIFIPCNETDGLAVNENAIDNDDLKLLSHLLEAIKMVLKEYNISWYENVEIVNVQANLLNLLKENFLTTKQVVQILDLLDICVKKFLSPNMSLLVEDTSRQGSTLKGISEAIKLYVQHEDWEMRDSAFNLLKSCTEISFIKYIPLQKVIKANNLIILTAKAGLFDPEFYSQCTALKCLAAATKIDSIWQEMLTDNEYFYLQLVYIVRNHTEGMVRKEATNVLNRIYVSQKLESGFQNNLYDVMTSAALNDLHWEVQLAALQFWKKVIHNHLAYRGMIDGQFPSVTFSKEKRKIVVLNKEEIQRQLVDVMNDLSAVGCLTVLVECMNEVHNIAVMTQAHSIAKELIEILDKYQFHNIDNFTVKTEEILPEYKVDKHIPVNLSNPSSVEERDKVIDSILCQNQIELIIALHDNFTQTKSDEMDIDYPCYYQHRKLVNPNEFLDIFRSMDYSLLIDNKKSFYADNIGTIGALLDEILNI